MIVWVASFPRSGNTFLRILLHRMYAAPTSVVYDVDGVAARLGAAFIGYEDRPASFDAMRASPVVHLVKTHRQRDDQIHDDDRVLHLVRDGRDALVSWARQTTEPGGPGHERGYEAELRSMIERDTPAGTGSWGSNVLSWRDAGPAVRVRYEDLIAAPTTTVGDAIGALVPELAPAANTSVPSFDELHAVDAAFFRRGITGSHRDELPPELADRFWARPDNVAAMHALGYT